MNNYCILGDCMKYSCHHCYPVKNCLFKHEICKNEGTCEEISNFNFILVTGCAGFIGFHVCKYLLETNEYVIGIDNINDYYDVNLKKHNITDLKKFDRFIFYEDDILNTNVISEFKPDKVIHLASQAGVRNSIQNPKEYCDVNIKGFIHILEECVKNNIKQIVYASSSSVYGLNTKVPFSEEDKIETCNSPYACSKMAMELFAKTYTQLYDISCIGLRFFTVYGPRGRPDMAPYKFMKAIINDESFDKYGQGTSSRDYTYIDDIVMGIIGALINKNNRKCEIYNLGNSNPTTLNDFISTCEDICKKKAKYNILPEQLGDVPHTYANISKAQKDLNFKPTTSLYNGLNNLYIYLQECK